ncbi:TonB-dependent receptor [Xanthobacteraceae bacterium Astr-EGSB]|uniref:TonB-dependent receptor family protein n=1 Tax=Astrobacterium formosum TaxID=3069710 RepID=UPI0027B83E53|nr:TonB-dependent receptor [Xanthobacteraceae bacterium Astr-EGSB]
MPVAIDSAAPTWFRPCLPARRRRLAAAVSMAALMSATGAFAQSAAPGATVRLEEIVVDAHADRTASSGEAQARRRLDATAGGTAVVATESLAGKANVSIADTLNAIPGVVASSFLGGNDQPKIHIRGSGQQTNPVERGLLMLQDGLPINRADGSYIVGLIDPRRADFLEVYRGYTANRLGATVLGGAINFVSPTGSSAPGAEIAVEGGGFGDIRTSIQGGARKDNLDALVQYSYSHRDGYRDWNESERHNFNFNAGAKINEYVSTRFFAGYTKLGFEVPGPLSWNRMQADPTQAAPGPQAGGTDAGPNALRDKPRRDTEQFRVGSRTTATWDAHVVDAAFGYTYTDDVFRFPIATGFRLTEGGDFTTSLRYAYAPDKTAALPLFEATAMYVVGSADRLYANNINGNQTNTYGTNKLDADTLSLWSGFNVPIGALTVSPAIAYMHATRDNTDTFGATSWTYYSNTSAGVATPAGSATARNTSFSRSYDAFNPSLAFTYDLGPKNTVFAAVSRSFEAPTFDDLIEATGGNPNKSPNGFKTPDLKGQSATTTEIGWRGQLGRFAWDVTTYYSWIDDELIRLTDGAAAWTINADKTRHFGVELGGSVKITDQVSARITYAYQDFRFVDDPLYGNNRIAGAPRNFVLTALRYTHNPQWWVEGELQWVPDDIPVDNANTMFSQDWIIANLRTRYAFNAQYSAFAEVRNVFDANYAVSTLTVGKASNPATQAAFLPGDGRSFYVGASAKF